ncbi:MAG: DNA cytosine methyltransferase, partial [Bacteroidaceae bacterium]|nr:DNA cytosine methyltransferase [Bacteroidaceae bacterium]
NVSIAINHDPAAILMHKTNHPHTEHLQDSVWNIDPVEICAGRPVGLAWFSPDCKHFSKAKGAALVDKNIRGLAWIVLKWAGTVRPRVIILENVEEFKTWGPVRKGKPIKARAGETFDKWFSQLEALGYKIEHRELVAADYGAPTTRKRFVLVARCDGKPIVWPERTHAPRDSEEVKTGKCKPWVSAAEIIDWSLPCPSIFESSAQIKEKYGLKAMRPLKDNTMRRIARGMDKFVIKSQKPFIIPVGYGERKGQAPRVNDIDNPVGTVVGTVKHNVVDPVLTPYALNHKFKNEPESLERPLSTITAVNGHEVVMPTLIQYHAEQSEKEVRASGFDKPLMTVDGSGRYAVAAAHLTQYFKGDHYHSPEDPLHTVTTKSRESVTLAHLTEFKGQDIGQDVNNPLRTITASVGEFGAVCTRLEKINGFNDLKFWPQVREMLNTYCGYNIAEDEILILTIGGINYFISDIGLRMLTPAELYRAQGFPEDYIIDQDYTGKPYPKSQQVARCGNAVCPPMAKAVVAVNLPEYCIADLSTMAALTNHMAV